MLSQSVSASSDRQYIRSGNRFYRQENYAKAEVEYRKALDKNSHNAQAMYNLGCALMQQQKDSLAILQLQNAGKTETAKLRKAMVYHNIGVICQKHRLYGDAIEAYKESLRNNPSDDETRYNLVLCMRQQKQNKDNQNDKQNKDNKNNKKDSDKKQNENQNQNKQDKQQKQQSTEKMSKDNAEQLLNYAVQAEMATQQRLNKNKKQSQTRRLKENW
jgi:batC protein